MGFKKLIRKLPYKGKDKAKKLPPAKKREGRKGRWA